MTGTLAELQLLTARSHVFKHVQPLALLHPSPREILRRHVIGTLILYVAVVEVTEATPEFFLRLVRKYSP